MGSASAFALVALLAGAVRADDPPSIEHQPVPCTVPEKPFSLCATVTDDSKVAKVRLFFRPLGEKYYSAIDMAFSGLNYCAVAPAPRAGKVKLVEYYVQAFDDQYQAIRTSTYRLLVQGEDACEFPPVEKDAQRAAAITIYATSKKQGKNPPGGFRPTGVTFVPASEK